MYNARSVEALTIEQIGYIYHLKPIADDLEKNMVIQSKVWDALSTPSDADSDLFLRKHLADLAA